MSKASIAHFDQGNYGIDPRDTDTPDNWVPRHPDLIRLTGRHPFNIEPPLTKLVDQGLITPPALHIVRNHGAVPKCDWDTHRVEIGGAVSNPISFSMDEIAAMETISFPCTVSCAGNRRKEQNMTKQTVGFNWGAAATGCSVWTGVPLRTILLKAGLKDKKDGARFVCMEGADKLPNGFYGTCMPIDLAMDPTHDVIIAFEQNGQRLIPDHGYPVRMIIPGWIGGRMVKWMTKITITEKESDNYYHFFDNRILPPQVDKEIADKDGWWYKPEYLFNELNINSAMASPAHGEVLKLGKAKTYPMRGYAYSGGGKKVTRVEVSFDQGKTWELATLSHLPPNHAGKYWTWCHWTYEAPVKYLMAAANSHVRVRAWDQTSNSQPFELTWNVMGMGNNPHFKVMVHPYESADGEPALWFEHPTIAGPGAGGWMIKPIEDFPVGTKTLSFKEPPIGKENWQDNMTNNAAYSPLAMKPGANKVVPATGGPIVSTKGSDGKRFITMAEVEQHSSEKDAWIVVKDRVYDATPFLDQHPGGSASITMNAGQDTTEDFTAVHSAKAWADLEQYYIGELVADGDVPPAAVPAGVTAVATTESGAPRALDPKKKVAITLVSKENLSSDVRRLRFALPTPQHVLGLPIGNHFFVNAQVDGAPCMRAYTPTSLDDDVGFVEMVIKVYFRNTNPRFPDGGKMSQHFESLKLGDTIDIKGPIGHFTYFGNGRVQIHKDERVVKELGFICGGTGITPAYQVMKKALKDPNDPTKFFLLYANQTPDDILLREDLDGWAKDFPDRVKIHYTVDRLPEGMADSDWPYSKGFINDEMLAQRMPKPGPGAFVGMCGPPPMINFACIPNLKKIGYDETDFLSF
mmetsp:Transcript_22396/g.32804  ORF Transcript_22396/g.32804 Transcript_22396/m.32804 type:complete len:859 (-) Transcript_22396:140-2716(-)